MSFKVAISCLSKTQKSLPIVHYCRYIEIKNEKFINYKKQINNYFLTMSFKVAISRLRKTQKGLAIVHYCRYVEKQSLAGPPRNSCF